MAKFHPDLAWEGRRPDGSKLTVAIEAEGSWDHLAELVRLAPDDMTWTYLWQPNEGTP